MSGLVKDQDKGDDKSPTYSNFQFYSTYLIYNLKYFNLGCNFLKFWQIEKYEVLIITYLLILWENQLYRNSVKLKSMILLLIRISYQIFVVKCCLQNSFSNNTILQKYIQTKIKTKVEVVYHHFKMNNAMYQKPPVVNKPTSNNWYIVSWQYH